MKGTKRDVKYVKDDEILQAKKASFEDFKAVYLLKGADLKRYYAFWYELRIDTLKVHATFLKTVTNDLICSTNESNAKKYHQYASKQQ